MAFLQGRVAFLRFLPITLKALKPKETDFEPRTLGEHVKRCRLIRKFTQKETAKFLRVSPNTVLNWEKGKSEPPIVSIPAILQFLDYDPFPEPKSLPERLLAKRRAMGWPIEEAARYVGVDEGTWGVWENGTTVPKGRHLLLLDAFLSKR